MTFHQDAPKRYPDHERRATRKLHPLQIAVISRPQLRLPIKDVQGHQRVQTAICTGRERERERELFILVSLKMGDGHFNGECDA